jgi:hypothetical protein
MAATPSPAMAVPRIATIQNGTDPAYGRGSALYSPDKTRTCRYQLTRRFDGERWDPRGRTLVTIGQAPAADGSATWLDPWAAPAANAALLAGYEQLVVVCLHSYRLASETPYESPVRWGRGVFGSSENDQFLDAGYLTGFGGHVAIAWDRPDRYGDMVLTSLREADATLYTVNTGGRTPRLMPLGGPDSAAPTTKLRLVTK